MLGTYKEIFAENPGLMQWYEYKIRVTDETAYKLRTYTILTEGKNE